MTTKATLHIAENPWYREPWPWIIAAGPIVVVIAGVITTTIAYSTADGLVADDYYKRGLTINRELARDQRADQLGLTARMRHDPTSRRVHVAIESADAAGVLPPSLTLKVIHSTRAAADRFAVLAAIERGVYAGDLDLSVEGTAPSRVAIESSEWRLIGTLRAGSGEIVTLRPANSQDAALIR
ncbi:MAG: FixH family protein [Burkholderiales bacterium]